MTSKPVSMQKIGYSVREACDASPFGKTSIYRHIKSGRLKSKRVGRRRVIDGDSLRELLQGGDI